MRGAFFFFPSDSFFLLSLSSINMVDDEKYGFYDRKRLTPYGGVISNLPFLRPFAVYFWCCWGARPATRASFNINSQWLLSNLQFGDYVLSLQTLQLELVSRIHEHFHSKFICKTSIPVPWTVPDRRNISAETQQLSGPHCQPNIAVNIKIAST